MSDVQTYVDLITSEYKDQPKFVAMIQLMASLPVQVQNEMATMIPKFDLDSPLCVGDQLDIIGKWVGITRYVTTPISGVFFTWDDTTYDGWDYGSWNIPGETQITALPDDVFLNLIRAKIAANQWDGTTEGAYAIWEAVFPTYQILIIDNCDMSFALAIVGGIVDSVTLALITSGAIPLRPEGVKITEYLVPTDDNPAFGFDVENEFVAGWDDGSWLREIAPT